MKDFAAEIRASLDIENFLNQAVIVLDIDATSLNDIVETILHKLLDEDEPKCTLDEAKGALFTHDNGGSSQGIYMYSSWRGPPLTQIHVISILKM